MSNLPQVTKTTHQLPFKQLSPNDFERLCLWLVKREGYERVQHFGSGGSDKGRDLVAWQDDRRVAFQCKRVDRFSPAEVGVELQKLLELNPELRPQDVVFLVTSNVSAEARDRASGIWAGRGSCVFWAGAELDEKVKRHPEVVQEFFGLSTAEPGGNHADQDSEGWRRFLRLDRDARNAVRRNIGLGQEHEVLHLERTSATRALHEKIRQHQHLLISGDSGAGKSALILREIEKFETAVEESQIFFVNLRLLPNSITELRNALGCELEDVFSEIRMAARLLVIDSAEYVAESAPDVLQYLARAARAAAMHIWAISTSEGLDTVRSVIEPVLPSLADHEIPLLLEDELEQLSARFPQLSSLVGDSRAKQLLRRPAIADLLVRADPSGHPLCEADALAIVWEKLVRADGRTNRGTPDAREQILRRLALNQLRPSPANDIYNQLDPAALDGLRRDGLLQASSIAHWRVLPEYSHELLRTFAVCQVLLAEGEPVSALLEFGVPRWALPAARLAAQILLTAASNGQLSVTSPLEEIQREFDRLAAMGHGVRWSDVPTEALLPLPSAGAAFRNQWRQLLANDARGLRRILRLIQQRHRHAGFITASIAEPVVELLLEHGWPSALEDEVDELKRDWLADLVRSNVPAGHRPRVRLRQRIIETVKRGDKRLAAYAAKRTEELAARTPEEVAEDEQRSQERLSLMFGSRHHQPRPELPMELTEESTLEELALLGPDLGTDGEALLRRVAVDAPHLLAPALEEVFTGRGLASNSPALLIELVESYYLDDSGWGIGHLNLDFGIRSHRGRIFAYGPLAAYYRGPFLVMLQTDFVNGVACLNKLLNHAAKTKATPIDNGSQSESETTEDRVAHAVLSITGEPRKYFGDRQVWQWYRGTGVGPYPCMSALQALEFVCDHWIRKGESLEELIKVLLEDCQNLAMPALVLGLLVRHLEKAGQLIDPYLTEPLIWRLDLRRAAEEHSPLAARSCEVHEPERRKWSLRDVATWLVLAAEGERIDALRQLGDRLFERAKLLYVESTDSNSEAADKPSLPAELAAVKMWASELDRGSYELTVEGKGIRVQAKVPEEAKQVLEPRNEDATRSTHAMSLAIRYTKDRTSKYGPSSVSSTTLEADLSTVKSLLDNPPANGHRLLNAPCAVAATVLHYHFIFGEPVADEDLSWCAQLLAAVSVLLRRDSEEHLGALEYDHSAYCTGADRSVACGLPMLFTPPAAELRSKLVEEGLTLNDLVEGARWCTLHAPNEVKLLYSKAMDCVWEMPCDAESSDAVLSHAAHQSSKQTPKHEPGQCHHGHAFRLLEDSARACALGEWDPSIRRNRTEHLVGPLESALSDVRTEDVIPHRLSPAIRALAVAANTANCCQAQAETLLAVLLSTHRRGMVGRDLSYHHRSTDTLIVARALLVEAANGKEGHLQAFIQHYIDNDDLLGELLQALAAAAEENERAAETACRVWPKVLGQVIDLIEAGDRPRGHHFFGSRVLSSLIPTRTSETAYQLRELEAEPIDWTDLLAWREQVERWLRLAAGIPGCVDSLVQALDALSTDEQPEIGLTWVEELVAGDPDEIASRSWFLPEWLKKIRPYVSRDQQQSAWQRIVDMLSVAGDTRVSDLSD